MRYPRPVAARNQSPTEYSRRVVANLERIRRAKGISNAILMAGSGLSNNYFYTRLRNEAPFTTDDLAAMSVVLKIEPEELSEVRVPVADPMIRIAANELERRIRKLNDGTVTAESELTSRGVQVARQAGSIFEVPETALVAIADEYDAPHAYLVNPGDAEVTERVEAELELRRALRRTGATPLAARALDSVTPEALRAIARSITNITDETQVKSFQGPAPAG